MLNPKVSIILPNYNHAPFLQQRLDSILNQSFQDFELILLDDASSDGSLAILQSYAQHPKVSQFVVNKHNSGSPFIQWQKGLALAKGKFVWIAESDDWNAPDFLAVAVKILRADASLFGVVCNIVSVNKEGSFVKHWNRYREGKLAGNDLVLDEFSFHNYILNASAVVFNKKHAETNADWAKVTSFRFCGDWLFWGLLAKDSFLYCTEKELCFWRSHDENVSTSAVKLGLHISEGLRVSQYLLQDDQLSLKKTFKIISHWQKNIHKGNFDHTSQKKYMRLLRHFFGMKYLLFVQFNFFQKILKKALN
jgi:glycosyltransferase involved in cell wall biosynthesis